MIGWDSDQSWKSLLITILRCLLKYVFLVFIILNFEDIEIFWHHSFRDILLTEKWKKNKKIKLIIKIIYNKIII